MLRFDAGGVKLDLLRHAYRLLEPVERVDGVTLVSLPDPVALMGITWSEIKVKTRDAVASL